MEDRRRHQEKQEECHRRVRGVVHRLSGAALRGRDQRGEEGERIHRLAALGPFHGGLRVGRPGGGGAAVDAPPWERGALLFLAGEGGGDKGVGAHRGRCGVGF